MDVIDIDSRGAYPANEISNFAHHPFVFDGVRCASMEGFLQSLKEKDPRVQKQICKLSGIEAKRRGKKLDAAWKREQTLWWKGKAYDRHGMAYQKLLNRAFKALLKNGSFRRALRATGTATLTHSVGKTDPRETVLTEHEFCSRLERVRAGLER